MVRSTRTAPVPPGSWFRSRRRPGRVGAVGVGRLLVFEAVQVTIFVVVVQELWALITGAVVGVLAVVLTFGRSHGRWWSEHLLLWLRYRGRLGAAGDGDGDVRLSAVRELVPDLVVENIDGPGGAPLGMGSDGAGWFTALEVVPAPEDRTRPPLPLAALARLVREAEQSGAVLQVVTHTVPGAGPPDGAIWVAVRLDSGAVAESMVDDADVRVDVPAVLAELTRRAGRVLRRRGLGTRLLSSDELLDALTRSCGLGSTAARVGERWDSWQAGDVRHGCFWLESWPDAERGTALLAALRELPARQTSLTLLLEPVGDGMALRCLVRVAAVAADYERACASARQLAERLGGRLFRLDGEHAPAVYATAPSGGGAR
ncbi:type VII secretion protein EccE [Prauserella cavernicola]|uniref:Type VII secretion protein EccE n=1 Tax=Prauserella cavernicola TaxID=2800127 RepID=A0A934V3W2_9PSEU|nr:type VII secretion protein EccE [Prauserella cavernicola]MBK1783475.1 type VII secretion protein EccE [Prauserella cavernicola]